MIAVVGAGPAGLRAAEVAASRGVAVEIFDAMSGPGRKFLVAGRGGLNITNSEPMESFVTRYEGGEGRWEGLLADFGPEALRTWVEGFGIETFVGSGKRVYPTEMKSAPLLRRWLSRLRSLGVRFHFRHRLTGLARNGALWCLDFGSSSTRHHAAAVVLATGGASWPQTGSDGSAVRLLAALGIPAHPFVPSNCGWRVAWPAGFTATSEGKPLKNIAGCAGGHRVTGELVITRDGLEGGVVYALTPRLREGSPLTLDLKPAWSQEELVTRLGRPKRLHLHEAFERWRLDATARELVRLHPSVAGISVGADLASFVKNVPIPVTGPRPIDEAISSGGGIAWSALDEALMVRDHPGLFAAGEMLDWEAPTGGYLMQGCFATGTRAGISAAAFVSP